MKSQYFLTIICLVLLAGCKDETVEPLNLRFEIQPLNPGSTWFYKDSSYTNDGLIIDSTRITIPGKTTLTGEPNSQGVAIWDVYTGGTLVKRNFLNLEQDGLYHYAEIHGPDTLHLRKLLVKYPVSVGDQFLEDRYAYNTLTHQYGWEGSWKWHCVSVDSQITIQNGTTLFCHIFKAQPDNVTTVFLIYSLNVGYTALLINKNGIRSYSQTLVNYQIK